MKHRLYYFSSDDGATEFVVISNLPARQIMAEHETVDAICREARDIDGDCTSWPCDRILTKE